MGLKLELRKRGETQVFLTNLLRYFLFSNCLENPIFYFPLKVTKIAIFVKKKSPQLFIKGMRTFSSPPEASFFQGLKLANTS